MNKKMKQHVMSIGLLILVFFAGGTTSTQVNGASNIFIVTNTASDGAGSLRKAIQDANANSGKDYIYFDIPTSDSGYDSTLGVWFINLTIVLPTLDDPYGVEIYGSTQPGTHPDLPGVIIQATPSIPLGAAIFTIISTSHENRINHLGIFNSRGNSILIEGDANIIEYNQIFTSEGHGIKIISDALHNYIHDNHICGHKLDNIHLEESGANTIANNIIGLQPEYLSSVAATIGNGITLSKGNLNSIDNNIISSNYGNGIYITLSDDNIIEHNTIGLGLDNDEDRGNGEHGILIDGGKNNRIFDNWISGNHSDGIRLVGNLTFNNKIERNKIGTSWHGHVPNHQHGIGIYDHAHDNFVGKPDDPLCGNIIAFNGWSGVVVVNSPYGGYNFIGSNSILYNQFYGVHVRNSFENYIINNRISGNGMAGSYAGVRIENDSIFSDVSDQNLIEYNGIDNHAGLGIELIGDANANILPPIIETATCSQVSGTASCGGCFVQLFSDNQDEGRVYEDSIITDSSGNFSWAGILTGPNVTATLIDPAGNTSQFSLAIHVGECHRNTYLPVIFK
jgi:parallel beta-helix repeat protein